MKRTSNVYLFGLAVILATVFTGCSSSSNKQNTAQNENPEEPVFEQEVVEVVEYIPDGYSSLFEHIDFYADTEEGKTLCFQILTPNTCGVTYKDKGRSSTDYNYDHYVAGTVTIPEKVRFEGDIYTVVSILPHAFAQCAKLGKVNLPSTIETLCERSFHGCKSLSTLIIPESVSTIESGAFFQCSGLTSITIPNSVTNFDGAVFSECTNLISVTIPNSITRIPGFCFESCSSLTSIIIPDGIEAIGYHSFQFCSSLTSIKIPDSVTKISDAAFQDCTSLKSIEIPKNIEIEELDMPFFQSYISSITYKGDIKQWKENNSGGKFMPSKCIVHCTDGDVSIN